MTVRPSPKYINRHAGGVQWAWKLPAAGTTSYALADEVTPTAATTLHWVAQRGGETGQDLLHRAQFRSPGPDKIAQRTAAAPWGPA